MATPIIKTTYALDAEVVRALEQMARRWGTSKSEALRRAIRAAAAEIGEGPADPLETLDKLQRTAVLRGGRASEWARKTRTERHSASARRETAAG
jgi:hypothetical protein